MKQFRMPEPGEMIHYQCLNCSHRFKAKKPISFFFFWLKQTPPCPACGSRKTIEDSSIRY